MARIELLVLIPESTRKRRGGDPNVPPVDSVLEALPDAAQEKLRRIRTEVHAKTGKGILEGDLLPAYRRFDGNMYRHIPDEVWEKRDPGVEVLIVSGLLGLIASRDTIPTYAHSMAEPMPPLGKLNRWWHAQGLPEILRAYLDSTRPATVVDLLSLEYREAVDGFAEGLKGVRVEVIDFPRLGRGSQPRRGERAAEILRTGKV